VQVTSGSQEVHSQANYNTIGEMGYGAEMNEAQSVQKDRHVARIQVSLLPFLILYEGSTCLCEFSASDDVRNQWQR